MSVIYGLVSCLRNRGSSSYLCISPLHDEFRQPQPQSSPAVSTAEWSWAPRFDRWLARPPAHPLNPINPDNARILRITAAAGTELADPYSQCTSIGSHDSLISPLLKKFTIHNTFILHATWLVQASAHWPIFLTAASRRSLVRVSVPMWGTFLSEPLWIVALVGRYPANKLIQRMSIRKR